MRHPYVKRSDNPTDADLISAGIEEYQRRGRTMAPASAAQSKVVSRGRTRFVAVCDQRGALLGVYQVEQGFKPRPELPNTWRLVERRDLDEPQKAMA